MNLIIEMEVLSSYLYNEASRSILASQSW